MSKARIIPAESKIRWALAVKFEWGWRFLGKHCWPRSWREDPPIPTFTTREDARFARTELESYRDQAHVVKVELVTRLADVKYPHRRKGR